MKPPLKRVLLYFLLALVAILISVFLVGAEKVHAQDTEPTETKQEVKEIPKDREDVLEVKTDELIEIKAVVEKVADEKETIEKTIQDTRSEIEKIKAELAEVKRVKAEKAAARLAAQKAKQVAVVVPKPIIRDITPGNTYAAGYCTWYVKNKRPDLPNNLGNANTWYAFAATQGIPVGVIPQVGAVGTTTRGNLGHVVYVEAINGDGTIMISEMNYAGVYSLRTRSALASEFVYIY